MSQPSHLVSYISTEEKIFSSHENKMFWLVHICQTEQHSPLLSLSEK